jgi:hypothetical protein
MTLKTTLAALAIAATALVAVSPAQAQWSGYHHRHGHYGGGAALGGFAAGALLGGALASQPYYYGPRTYYGPAPVYEDDAVDYCASRFRSYDPRSGTYLGNDGYRHPCP